MDEERTETKYLELDRLLGMLGQGIATRLEAREGKAVPTRAREDATTPMEALTESRETPSTLLGAARAAWREPADPVVVTTRPRGVGLDVVLRGTLRHFLPGAALVVFPVVALLRLADPLDWITVAAPLGVLPSLTLGFALGLGAVRRRIFPHANPDGVRSEVAGLMAPLITLGVGMGLSRWIAPLPTVPEFASIYALSMVVGACTALATYAPWLRPTEAVASPSPVHRWRTFRATVVTGVAGAAVFGPIRLALFLTSAAIAGLPTGVPLHVLAEWLLGGVFTGFVVGVLFAVVLAAVYRRVGIDELRPWRVGLCGAAVGVLPVLRYLWLWIGSGGTRWIEATWVTRTLVTWSLPGFLLAYGAVKLAQRAGGDE